MSIMQWKRLRPVITVLLILSGALSHTGQAQQDVVDLRREPWKEPLPEGLYIKPYLQNVTQYSIVVMWETKAAVIGHVDYGETESLGRTISEPEPVTIHEIEIGELEPGTIYHYRVRYGGVTLDASTFKTAPPDGVEHCRIIVYGDARSNPKQHRKNVEQMLKLDADLILHTGDIVASGIVYEQWQPQHFWPTQIIGHKVPSFPTLGNHEKNSTHHFNYLSLPGNEVYYSFDYANVHMICLDSNKGSTPYQKGTPQYEWLINDLKANQDAEWIFVYFHHPIFRCHPTRGIQAQRYTWHPIFEKYGVDIVFAGHDHYYFRSYPIGKVGLERKQGVLYVISGGGGAPLYPARDRIYGAVSNSIHHFTVLDIQGSRIEARAIDSDGDEIDYFTLTHTPTPGDEYIAYELFEVERDLRKQLADMKPIVVKKAGDRIAVDTTLSISANFDIRIEGEIVWDESDKWKFAAQKTPFVVNPGGTFKIPIKAEATYPNIYPIPKMTVHFSKRIGRKEGFRNDKMTFDAIKIQPLLPITVPRIHSPVVVNGKLDEPAWVAAKKLQGLMLSLDLTFQSDLDAGMISERLRQRFKHNGITLSRKIIISVQKEDLLWLIADEETRKNYTIRKAAGRLNVYPPNFAKYPQDFVTAQGDRYPTQPLTVMLAHDGKYLYAAAKLGSDAEIVEELLFSTALGFQSDLDKLIISTELVQTFEENDILLSQNTVVSIKQEGGWWVINDKDERKNYSVRKEGARLNISLEERATSRDSTRILNSDDHFALFLSYETQERFRMALAFQSDLDDLVLSEDLLQVFETNDIPLSEKSTISVKQKGTEWL
ncbi:MAG: metallophosphoesterase family protein, partial [Candidatus Poribacteria bacterium]|nr:metallophosphoesterase family protein [Candidatus Poribacteria bacterium]